MSETVSAFEYGSDSLDHRVGEYLVAVQAHSRMERSTQFANDASWSDRFGSSEDIAVAEAILKLRQQQDFDQEGQKSHSSGHKQG